MHHLSNSFPFSLYLKVSIINEKFLILDHLPRAQISLDRCHHGRDHHIESWIIHKKKVPSMWCNNTASIYTSTIKSSPVQCHHHHSAMFSTKDFKRGNKYLSVSKLVSGWAISACKSPVGTVRSLLPRGSPINGASYEVYRQVIPRYKCASPPQGTATDFLLPGAPWWHLAVIGRILFMQNIALSHPRAVTCPIVWHNVMLDYPPPLNLQKKTPEKVLFNAAIR